MLQTNNIQSNKTNIIISEKDENNQYIFQNDIENNTKNLYMNKNKINVNYNNFINDSKMMNHNLIKNFAICDMV